MGNSASSPLVTCLNSAVNNNPLLISTARNPFYQITDVRPYNLDRKVTPIAVTYPETNEQVSAIVKCAGQYNTKVQARGGGHSYANYCIGGTNDHVVVDLKNFQAFSYDQSTQRAHFGGGYRLGDLDKKLDTYQRAVAHGTCPQVGIGGHATIGGLGPPSRMWGTMLDHVLGATVVLADGSVVHASEQENPDVFFAIKGAGAGFGIVTDFELITYPQPGSVVEYNYGFNYGGEADLGAAFAEWQSFVTAADLDRKFASQFIITPAGAIVSGTYFGTEQEFKRLNVSGLFPKKDNDSTIVFDDWLGVAGHWAEDTALQIVGGLPASFYSQNLPFKQGVTISQQGINDLFGFIENSDKDTLLWFVIFDLAGGAVTDPPLDSSAYAGRDVTFYMQSYAIGLTGLSDTTRSWVRDLTTTITRDLPGVQFGSYPGYVDPELGARAQTAYWGSNLPRLEQIKARIDPQDIFSNPQSVRPAGARS